MKVHDTVYLDLVKVGDAIWQDRLPGGWCVVLEVLEWDAETPSPKGWIQADYPVYKVYHPTEGIIEDPSYYYITPEEKHELLNRVWKDGKIIGYKEGYTGLRRFEDESG